MLWAVRLLVKKFINCIVQWRRVVDPRNPESRLLKRCFCMLIGYKLTSSDTQFLLLIVRMLHVSAQIAAVIDNLVVGLLQAT